MTKRTQQKEIKQLLFSEYPQIKQDVEEVATWLAEASNGGEWYVRKAFREQASTMDRAISKMEETTVHNYTWSYKRAQAMVQATIGGEARKRVRDIPSFMGLSGPLASADEEEQGDLVQLWNEWCGGKDSPSAIPRRPWETYGEEYRQDERWSTGPRGDRSDIYQEAHTVPGTWKGIGHWFGIDKYSGPDSSLLVTRKPPTDNLWENVPPPHFYDVRRRTAVIIGLEEEVPTPPPSLLVNQELHDVTEWFERLIQSQRRSFRKADTIAEAILQEEFQRIFNILSGVRDELRSIKKI